MSNSDTTMGGRGPTGPVGALRPETAGDGVAPGVSHAPIDGEAEAEVNGEALPRAAARPPADTAVGAGIGVAPTPAGAILGDKAIAGGARGVVTGVAARRRASTSASAAASSQSQSVQHATGQRPCKTAHHDTRTID